VEATHKPTNNPTHSTNPTAAMYPKALQNIIGVGYVMFVGCIWDFFPGRIPPLFTPVFANYLPGEFEGVL